MDGKGRGSAKLGDVARIRYMGSGAAAQGAGGVSRATQLALDGGRLVGPGTSPNGGPHLFGAEDANLPPVPIATALTGQGFLSPHGILDYVHEPGNGHDPVVAARMVDIQRRMAVEGHRMYGTQHRALVGLHQGMNVLLKTPQATGKTKVAEEWLRSWLESRAHASGHRAYYTSPTKALAHEKFFLFCRAFGRSQVALVTGESKVNVNAPIVCCTAEVLSHGLLNLNTAPWVDRVVMDEAHFYGDGERGTAWMLPLLLLPQAQFLLMSATLGDTTLLETLLRQRTGRPSEVVESDARPFPLRYVYWDKSPTEAVEDLLASGQGPLYIYSAIRMRANRDALDLAHRGSALRSGTQAHLLREAVRGHAFVTSFGELLRDSLLNGVGIHHGGLAPASRLLVEELYRDGILPALYGTDTLALGVNLPIRTLVVARMEKSDGNGERRILSRREFKQMSGRAGRDGKDGLVVALAPPSGLPTRAARSDPPPPRWDRSTFESLITGAPEPLEPKLSLGHELLLGLLRQEDPTRAFGQGVTLIRAAGLPPERVREELRLAAQRFRGLVQAGIVHVESRNGDGPHVRLGDIPPDLSLHAPLALFLYDYTRRLDPSLPDHADRVLAAAEAIEECPVDSSELRRATTLSQLPHELLTLGDEVQDDFYSFRKAHAWAADEAPPRPKYLAMQMLHGRKSFARFLHSARLAHNEGEVLTYLGRVQKLLAQSLPASARTAAVEQMVHRLTAGVMAADGALLRAWRELEVQPAGTIGLAESSDLAAAPLESPVQSIDDVRPRLEAELAVLQQLLHAQSFDHAIDFSRNGRQHWNAAALWARVERLPSLSPGPALGEPTELATRALTESVWEVRCPVFSRSGEKAGTLVGRVDLSAPPPPGEGLFQLEDVEPIGFPDKRAASR